MRVIVHGLWNRLSEHQNARTPFRLPRFEVLPTRQSLLELEGLPGEGEAVLRQGQVPSLTTRITTPSLDLDSLVTVEAGGGAQAHAFDLLAPDH